MDHEIYLNWIEHRERFPLPRTVACRVLKTKQSQPRSKGRPSARGCGILPRRYQSVDGGNAHEEVFDTRM